MESNTVPRINGVISKMCKSKGQYRTYDLALRYAVRRLGKKNSPPQLRPYLCPICNYYHLTKQEPR